MNPRAIGEKRTDDENQKGRSLSVRQVNPCSSGFCGAVARASRRGRSRAPGVGRPQDLGEKNQKETEERFRERSTAVALLGANKF
ncbi:Hypothetical protein SMAX5B_003205 [Scophthalmus maximus]|uniref:Uncharacterized protein n=1 Tax=Scophthalmus maximus TaxID=52904 RepID=A0A2U9BE04_SCOMX|nr:Hypothetical protein SMAX5B_003205 [Scophthalmus maximus]